MLHTFRARLARFGSMGAVLAVLAITATGLSPAAAAATTTTFTASFTERTTFVACPQGTPAGAVCFTGVGHGPVVPPADPNGNERFAGFVVPSTGMDANVVSISTDSGTLFLTTQGVVGNGGATENGTWTAHGGTGIFEGATGSGPVATVETGANPDGSVNSQTTYGGMLTLH